MEAQKVKQEEDYNNNDNNQHKKIIYRSPKQHIIQPFFLIQKIKNTWAEEDDNNNDNNCNKYSLYFTLLKSPFTYIISSQE